MATVETFEIDPAAVAESISATPAALAHLRKQLDKQGKRALRLSLKQSGCTGFMYVIEEIDEPAATDQKRELGEGILLYVDVNQCAGLRGLEIDYRQEGLNRNLVMNNPNVKDACGCGESFSFQ